MSTAHPVRVGHTRTAHLAESRDAALTLCGKRTTDWNPLLPLRECERCRALAETRGLELPALWKRYAGRAS